MNTTNRNEIIRIVKEVLDPIIGEAIESLDRDLFQDILEAITSIKEEVKLEKQDMEIQLINLRTNFLAELFKILAEGGRVVLGITLPEDQLNFSLLINESWDTNEQMIADLKFHLEHSNNPKVLRLWGNCSKVTVSGDGTNFRFLFSSSS